MRMSIRLRSHRRNSSSRLLSKQENEQLVRLIGSHCQSVATAVVQLFIPEQPHYTQWMKKDCGVLCMVEDKKNQNQNQPTNGCWLRIYCLVRRTVLWEQKLDDHFVYRAPTAYFHTISSLDNTQIGINFADEGEAAIFLRTTRAYLLKKKMLSTKPGNFNENISPPTDFRLISHIGWHRLKGFTVLNADDQVVQTFLSGFCNRANNKANGYCTARPHQQVGSFRRKNNKISKNDISSPIDVKQPQYHKKS